MTSDTTENTVLIYFWASPKMICTSPKHELKSRLVGEVLVRRSIE